MKTQNKIVLIILIVPNVLIYLLGNLLVLLPQVPITPLNFSFHHANIFHLAGNLYALYLFAKHTFRQFPLKTIIAQIIAINAYYSLSVFQSFSLISFSTVGFSAVLFSLSGIEISQRIAHGHLKNPNSRNVLCRFIAVSVSFCIIPLIIDTALYILNQPPLCAPRVNSALHLLCLLGGASTWYCLSSLFFYLLSIKNDLRANHTGK